MVYLSKKDAGIVIKELSKNSNAEIKGIVKRLKSLEKRKIYVTNKSDIRKLLHKAFNEKRKIKIKYYSPHSDENTMRIVDIYKIYSGVIACFCHLREDERNFVIDRINSVAILDERYSIPKGWSPESIILDR
ncbi:MAG: WYL domain-containing protein [Nanoarchaeota archaeon]|nr:WYL domain-containing protein [Nanoarchaeota archaeon]